MSLMYWENLDMLPINTNFKITRRCSYMRRMLQNYTAGGGGSAYSIKAHSSDEPGPWLLRVRVFGYRFLVLFWSPPVQPHCRAIPARPERYG